jgi:hypothetical protein
MAMLELDAEVKPMDAIYLGGFGSDYHERKAEAQG